METFLIKIIYSLLFPFMPFQKKSTLALYPFPLKLNVAEQALPYMVNDSMFLLPVFHLQTLLQKKRNHPLEWFLFPLFES